MASEAARLGVAQTTNNTESVECCVLAGIEKYGRQDSPADWEPAPLLVRLVSEGSTFTAWQASRHG